MSLVQTQFEDLPEELTQTVMEIIEEARQHRMADLFPISKLPTELNKRGHDVSEAQLYEWSRKGGNDFPKPVRKLSKYNFYSLDAVEEWLVLWRRATSNFRNNPSKERQFNGPR